jgi:hypothetical protein
MSNFVVVLNVCEMWFVELSIDHISEASESKALRKIFGPKKN